jgi:hypothetical protein
MKTGELKTGHVIGIGICAAIGFLIWLGVEDTVAADQLMVIVIPLGVWLGFSLLVGSIAGSKGKSAVAFTVISLIISPLLGLVALLLIAETDKPAAPTPTTPPWASRPERPGSRPLPPPAPASSEDRVVKFHCPHCGQRINGGNIQSSNVTCPVCAEEFEIAIVD